jgi:ribokinase
MKYDCITIGDSFEDVFVVPEEAKIRRDGTYASGMSLSFELGDKIPLDQVDYEIGGSACNVAVGLSRLKLNASVISILGQDTPAVKIRERLDAEGVSRSNLITDKKMKTNFSVIFRTDRGRTIFIYHGLKDYGGLRIKKSIKSAWIFLGPTGENTSGLENDIISKISEESAKLAWNPGSLQVRKGAGKFKSLLKNCSVIFLNREEAIDFINFPVRPNDDELLKRIHSLGPKIAIITYGKKGAKAYDGKNFYEIGSLDVVRIDSTGAGDSFSTGFLGKLLTDKIDFSNIDLDIIAEALRWGIFNSNSVITKIGAQPGLLTLNEIEKESKEYKRLNVEVR